MEDIYRAINDGRYTNQMAYPANPKAPEILKKSAGLLTEQEIASLPKVKEDYAASIEQTKGYRESYYKEEKRLSELFYNELHEFFKVPPDHEFIKAIWSEAWDKGHYNGYYEVALHFDNLINRFWHLAIKLGMK